MEWIEYDYVCNEGKGIVFHKKVENNATNLAIAKAEACNGEYTIKKDPKAKSTGILESADYPGCFYRLVVDEEEWINPPMVAGVEYRTTERFNGAPVYTKVVEAIIPDKGASSNDVIASYATACLLCECFSVTGGILHIGNEIASVANQVLKASFNNTQGTWSPGAPILWRAKYIKYT